MNGDWVGPQRSAVAGFPTDAPAARAAGPRREAGLPPSVSIVDIYV
jgi:hypothetical protein